MLCPKCGGANLTISRTIVETVDVFTTDKCRTIDITKPVRTEQPSPDDPCRCRECGATFPRSRAWVQRDLAWGD